MKGGRGVYWGGVLERRWVVRRCWWVAGAGVMVVGVLAGAGWERYRAIGPFSGEARWVLRGAERFELMSLDPSHEDFDPRRAGTMHGYRIVGRAAVSDGAEQRRLVEGVLSGVEAKEVESAKCFNPRHGIRAERGGRVVEVVICFGCKRVEVYVDGAVVSVGGTTEVRMEDGAKGMFEEAVRRAGLGVAAE